MTARASCIRIRVGLLSNWIKLNIERIWFVWIKQNNLKVWFIWTLYKFNLICKWLNFDHMTVIISHDSNQINENETKKISEFLAHFIAVITCTYLLIDNLIWRCFQEQFMIFLLIIKMLVLQLHSLILLIFHKLESINDMIIIYLIHMKCKNDLFLWFLIILKKNLDWILQTIYKFHLHLLNKIILFFLLLQYF